ncbi:hypothetical protein V8E55_003275, partial [Tylopilus felleus]
IQRRLLLEPISFPLENFACIQELLSVLIDIVDVHEQLVIRCSILHCDISIKNMLMYIYHHQSEHWSIWSSDPMILGRLLKREEIIQKCNYRRGLLINFNYSKFTDEESVVSEGEQTGTIPFMALEILHAFASETPVNFTHQPKHDLESIVYVLIWICVLYSNPNSLEHRPCNPHEMCLSGWASCKTCKDVEMLWSTKTGELLTQVPIQYFTPYFHGLKEHIAKLYQAIANNALDHRVLRETLLDAFWGVQELSPDLTHVSRSLGVVLAKRSMKPEVRTSKRARC